MTYVNAHGEKVFHSPYEPDKTLTVELFTWEKLDYVDVIKEKLF